MKAKAVDVQIFGSLRNVQHVENAFNYFGKLRVHASTVVILKKPFETFVPKLNDHNPL